PSRVMEMLEPGSDSQRQALEGSGCETVEGADGNSYVIDAFEDATGIRMQVALGYAEPEVMGALVAAVLGDLVEEHDDPRGVALYPETYQPRARTWAGLLEEMGDALDWAPLESAEVMLGDFGSELDFQGDLVSLMAQMQEQVSPEMLEKAMRFAQHLIGNGQGTGLSQAEQELLPDMAQLPNFPMDFGTLAEQAQRLFEANPQLEQRLAEPLGMTDAVVDDGDDESGEPRDS
ncbi:MAG TPA: hypothetical protein PK710_11315, partial [Polyangiaceae bacterium]|nr:hypothetical protein [Polyangiaceae bacterium]